MQTHLQRIAGVLVSLASLGVRATPAPAQDSFTAPTYARTRNGADDWQARGGAFAQGHDRGGFGWHGGFFQPYVSPVIASSWYARPYPYHFDYFRGRWGGGPGGYDPAMATPTSDCPCAHEASPVPSP